MKSYHLQRSFPDLTPQKKNAFCNSKNAFLKHLGPKKTQPSARIPGKVWSAKRWPVFFPISGNSLGHPRDIFQRKTVSRNHANSGKSSILGELLELRPFPFPSKFQRWPGGWAPIFRGDFLWKTSGVCITGLVFSSTPVISFRRPQEELYNFHI